MREYVLASRDDASFAQYLKSHVYDVASHEQYVRQFVPQQSADSVAA